MWTYTGLFWAYTKLFSGDKSGLGIPCLHSAEFRPKEGVPVDLPETVWQVTCLACAVCVCTHR
jgi:hypothetical protein